MKVIYNKEKGFEEFLLNGEHHLTLRRMRRVRWVFNGISIGLVIIPPIMCLITGEPYELSSFLSGMLALFLCGLSFYIGDKVKVPDPIKSLTPHGLYFFVSDAFPAFEVKAEVTVTGYAVSLCFERDGTPGFFSLGEYPAVRSGEVSEPTLDLDNGFVYEPFFNTGDKENEQ